MISIVIGHNTLEFPDDTPWAELERVSAEASDSLFEPGKQDPESTPEPSRTAVTKPDAHAETTPAPELGLPGVTKAPQTAAMEPSEGMGIVDTLAVQLAGIAPGISAASIAQFLGANGADLKTLQTTSQPELVNGIAEPEPEPEAYKTHGTLYQSEIGKGSTKPHLVSGAATDSITIGPGLDLGTADKAVIEKALAAGGFDDQQIEELVAVSNLKGKKAQKWIDENASKYKITDQQQQQIFEVTSKEYASKAASVLNDRDVDFYSLDPKQQEIFTYMVYKLGAKGLAGHKQFIPALLSGDVEKALDQRYIYHSLSGLSKEEKAKVMSEQKSNDTNTRLGNLIRAMGNKNDD